MSIIMVELGRDWSLTTTSTGMIATSFMTGTASGSYLCGYLGDKYGRMRVFKSTPFIGLVGCIGLMFSYEYMMVILYSVIIGISMGGELALGGTVWSEYCPPSKDWSLVLLTTFWCFGGSFSAALALLFILIGSETFEMWKFVVGVSALFLHY
jgi:putative MFS transporter